ncbi:hypothetical protein SRA_01819 [Streptococcus ratti FA-1 = DSM 20564]|uniref:Uncharacterized protein n=1 Tax=Streptococcus ratti FA-1 = DSM 20564 TaxID=699248 RepID=A0ABP2R3B3_STRRT|nr:hypothetical protein SRA_01819 [Streptococcus ratti FA-1 = DSM 20564]
MPLSKGLSFFAELFKFLAKTDFCLFLLPAR